MTNPTVQFLNWEKYNPRKDVKNPSWFRLDHDMITDSEFFSFSGEEVKAWIYLLSEASKKNRDTITINLEHAERVCRLPPATIASAIEKLVQIGALLVHATDTSRARHADVTFANATNERDVTNEANERARTRVSVEDLKTGISEAEASWLGCLKHHGAERKIMPDEQTRLARQIQTNGLDAVLLALLGAKHEPATDEFKPSRHLSLLRVFDPTKFDRFVTLGAQAKNQAEARARTQAQLQAARADVYEPTPEEIEHADPAKVRALVAGIGKGNP